MKKLITFLDSFVKWSAFASLTVMSLCILLQVFCRYVLNSALPWPEEVARFAFLWSSYLGICMLTAKNGHLRIELLPMALGRTANWLLNLFCMLCNFAFFIFLFRISMEMTFKVHTMEMASSVLSIPYWVVWLCIPFSGAVCALYSLQFFIAFCKKEGVDDNLDKFSCTPTEE